MRPFGETIPLEAARAIVDRSGTPIARVETIPLEHADGRVIARDVVAPADVPPFSRAAMDGYAVRSVDTRGASRGQPRRLHQIGTLFTGEVPTMAVGKDECVEISTGAPMPEGADAVVVVEETDCDAARLVDVFVEVQPTQNVGRRAADIQAGQTVLRSGEALNSSRVGAVAALGMARVEVYERPRVAILSTGNEVTEPGHPLKPGHIYDINRFTLSAVVFDNGGLAVAFPPASDTRESLTDALERCLANDVVVFSGGSSVGERDLMIDVLSAIGDVLFHGISVKPGKPTGFAMVNGKPVFAMPGYPASCLTNAHILLAPLVRRLAHLPPKVARTLTLPLAERIVSAPNRHQFYTVRIVDGSAVPAFKASGDITSMSLADGYMEIPAEVEAVERGSLVEVTLF
jgi:molybdenum cofactor synthesis domain-containing protein